MSKQSYLDRYFKSKSSPSPVVTAAMTDKNIKKRSLSLVKPLTPAKAPKMNSLSVTMIKTEQEVVNLCSDDENTSSHENMSNNHMLNHSDASDFSQTTINYNLTPSTPLKSPQVSSSNSFSSPNSQKFFSPTKKRAVFKRTPVKKNLAKEYYGNGSQPEQNSIGDEDFNEACKEMDDKSIFLLTIINKCLKDESLKKLLDDMSVELLSCCFHTVKPGIRLICRLFWRQHGWYRKEKLRQITSDKKEDIGDPQFVEMLNCLLENGLLTADTNTITFDDLIKVLKSEEIKQICKDLKLKVHSKQNAENALRQYSQQSSISKFFKQASNTNNSNRVLGIMKSKAGTCYKLSELVCCALSKLYLLMYLGINYEIIREKRLEFILINDKIKRETYPVDNEMVLDNASVVFGSKEEFAKYWNAHLINEDYLKQMETSAKCSIISNVYKLYKEIDDKDMLRYKALPTWLRRYTPAYIYVKLLECGVQELKKDKLHHQLAVEILSTLISQMAFRQHKKAEWYAEKALVLHKLLARHDAAAEVLLEGLKSDLSEEAKDAMRPRALKIAHQQNITLAPGLSDALIEYASKGLILERTFKADHVRKQHMEQSSKQRGKKKFEVHTDDGKKFLDAEEYCVLHYTSNGEYTHGEHREGRIVTAMYFLLFWDIIYTKPLGVVGVFLSYYQLYPLDMYDGSFYINRKTLIDDRLRSIESMTTDELIEFMKLKWDERPEHELSLRRDVRWECVRAAAACLGARAAAALCRRLATNYGYAHSGFPDLTLWNMLTKTIKFVEVKTDTDKPSMKQLQWMQYLREHGIDTGFCYVGVSSTRCRARAAGTGGAPDVRARAADTAGAPDVRARAADTAGAPDVRARAADTAGAPDVRARAADTAGAPDVRARAADTAGAPDVRARAADTAGAPDVRARAADTAGAPDVRARATDTAGAPDVRARAADTAGAPDVRARAADTAGAPDVRARGADTAGAPDVRARAADTAGAPGVAVRSVNDINRSALLEGLPEI